MTSIVYLVTTYPIGVVVFLGLVFTAIFRGQDIKKMREENKSRYPMLDEDEQLYFESIKKCDGCNKPIATFDVCLKCKEEK